jgi:hypothetical protein
VTFEVPDALTRDYAFRNSERLMTDWRHLGGARERAL